MLQNQLGNSSGHMKSLAELQNYYEETEAAKKIVRSECA